MAQDQGSTIKQIVKDFGNDRHRFETVRCRVDFVPGLLQQRLRRSADGIAVVDNHYFYCHAVPTLVRANRHFRFPDTAHFLSYFGEIECNFFNFTRIIMIC